MDITQIIDSVAAPLIAGFIAVERLKNPQADAPALTAAADGDLKHYVRGKIGFGADILWSITQFKDAVDAEIACAVGQELGTPAAPPLTPASAG